MKLLISTSAGPRGPGSPDSRKLGKLHDKVVKLQGELAYAKQQLAAHKAKMAEDKKKRADAVKKVAAKTNRKVGAAGRQLVHLVEKAPTRRAVPGAKSTKKEALESKLKNLKSKLAAGQKHHAGGPVSLRTLNSIKNMKAEIAEVRKQIAALK